MVNTATFASPRRGAQEFRRDRIDSPVSKSPVVLDRYDCRKKPLGLSLEPASRAFLSDASSHTCPDWTSLK